MVYATKGALHFFDQQARNLVQPHQSLFFFLPILLNSHGRQAGTGRRTGRAGIVHYFAISFTLSARFFFFFSILSQLYIRPDIEIKQTSSGGRSLFSLASSLLQLFFLAWPTDRSPSGKDVCGLMKLFVLLFGACMLLAASEDIHQGGDALYKSAMAVSEAAN
ncbi:hypothetical protein B0I37DRAFT_212059 [Chaetomium sp. MPI-CAGE-AT-0009]|nr:hypothetical protein B0I37DRAFT_212059 [Chaetomium sp. MPI-CAGE-AT-0009]